MTDQPKSPRRMCEMSWADRRGPVGRGTCPWAGTSDQRASQIGGLKEEEPHAATGRRQEASGNRPGMGQDGAKPR